MEAAAHPMFPSGDSESGAKTTTNQKMGVMPGMAIFLVGSITSPLQASRYPLL